MLQVHRIAVAMLAVVMAIEPVSVAAQSVATAPQPSAQRPPVSPEAAAAAAAPAPEGDVLTIFGRRKPGTLPSLGRLDPNSGSSCAFMASGNGNDPGISGEEEEETYDDYLDDNSRRRKERYASLREKAPFGSAMDGPEAYQARQAGSGSRSRSHCNSSDLRFDAGRSAIESRDTSLRDAYQAFDNKDYAAALELFRKSYTKMGYVDAALMLGKMHLVGLGTPQNTPEAIAWLTKATEGRFSPGNAQRFNEKDPGYMSAMSDASMLLGRIYMTGWNIPKDPVKARKWHMKADTFGFIPGTYIVGRMFDSGYGGEKSVVKAAKYYKKAGEVGYAPAQYDFGILLLQGDEGVAAKPKEGAQWLIEAAKRGHPEALYEVGRMYDLGQVVAADAQKAIVYYKEAALKGNAQAQTALGTYFYTGEIVGRDLVMARRWFYYAAENGDPQAMLNLGVMLMNGEGGDKDPATAYALFRLAAQAGLEDGVKAADALLPKLTAEEKTKAEAILNPRPA